MCRQVWPMAMLLCLPVTFFLGWYSSTLNQPIVNTSTNVVTTIESVSNQKSVLTPEVPLEVTDVIDLSEAFDPVRLDADQNPMPVVETGVEDRIIQAIYEERIQQSEAAMDLERTRWNHWMGTVASDKILGMVQNNAFLSWVNSVMPLMGTGQMTEDKLPSTIQPLPIETEQIPDLDPPELLTVKPKEILK